MVIAGGTVVVVEVVGGNEPASRSSGDSSRGISSMVAVELRTGLRIVAYAGGTMKAGGAHVSSSMLFHGSD